MPHEDMGKRRKRGKVEKVMHEYKHGELHSGSKHGPMVMDRRQAVAIAMSEAKMSNRKRRKPRGRR